MKAWLLDDFAGIEKLRLADAPDPRPAPSEAILEVRFAAINPADRYLAEKQYPAHPPLPHILGRDGMGTIVELGLSSTTYQVGQRVIVLRGEVGVSRWGTLAEQVAVPVESLAPVPDGWKDEEAAGAPLVYLTAYQALTQWDALPPSVVLISGASGGVGVAAVQLARAMGHVVIALSRDADKRLRLKELGASEAFDPSDPTWRNQLKDRLGQRRVDLVIDSIGGTLLPEMIEMLGMNGKVSVVGRLAGPVPQFNTAALFFRRIRMGGVAVGTYSPPETQRVWQQVLGLLTSTGARPLVDRVFPFQRLLDAFGRLKQGPMGKVLIQVHAS